MKHVKGQKKDLGGGTIVNRLFPRIGLKTVGPFIFVDHMGPETISSKEHASKVRAHPHIGLSTLTYLLSGSITHRDSLGNIVKIVPGEVNWMTAGGGDLPFRDC